MAIADRELLQQAMLAFDDALESGQGITTEVACERANCPQLAGKLRRALALRGRIDDVLDPELRPDRPPSLPRVPLPYVPLSFLAAGGLGEVFLAEDKKLHRIVALKVIKRLVSIDGNEQKRFLREAEITSKLDAPGVVAVHDFGQCDDGRAFYVMRFIKGHTFERAITQFHEEAPAIAGDRVVDFYRLLRQFISVCETIAHSHSRGIVHRDIKPSNVMISKGGETLVVDWGLACRTDLPDDADAEEGPIEIIEGAGVSATRTGRWKGSPAYMSPEQARGEKPVRPAWDVYSLGATLFSLLTGRIPYSGKTDVEIIQQVSSGQFAPPSKMKSDVPKPLEAICLKAMAFRLEDRYQSVLALAKDVERWLADEPVSAAREPLRIRTRRWLKRNRPLVAGVAAALVVGMVAGLWSIVQEREKNEKLSIINRDLVKANANTDFEKKNVETQRDIAQENFGLARHNLYLARMLPVGFSLADQQHERAWNLLRNSRPKTGEYDDHRGFEWYCAWNFFDKSEQRVIQLPPGFARTVLSSDGKRLVSTPFSALRVTRVADGQTLLEQRGEGRFGFVTSAHSGDASVFAIVGVGAKIIVKFLDGDEKERAGPILEGFTHLSTLAVSADGKLVVGYGDERNDTGHIRIWDARSGMLLHHIQDFVRKNNFYRFSGGHVEVIVSRDSRWLAFIDDGKVALWNIEGKQAIVPPNLPAGIWQGIRFTDAGTFCVWNNSGELWSWTLPRTGVAFNRAHRRIETKTFIRDVWDFPRSGEEPMLVVNGSQGLVGYRSQVCPPPVQGLDFLPAVMLAPVGFPIPHPASVVTLSATSNGKTWAIADLNDKLTLVDVEQMLEPALIFRHAADRWVNRLHFAPGDQLITIASDQSVVCGKVDEPARWSWAAPPMFNPRDHFTLSYWSTSALSPNGKRYAVRTESDVRIVSVATGLYEIGFPLFLMKRTLNVPLAFVGPSRLLFALETGDEKAMPGHDNRRLLLWNFEPDALAAKQPLKELMLPSHANAVAASPDGVWLAAGGTDGRLRLWKTSEFAGKTNKEWIAGAAIRTLLFAPEGDSIAAGCDDGSVCVWRLNESAEPVRIVAHTATVTALIFSPDGRSLVSGSSDGRIKFLDRKLWQELYTIANWSQVNDLAFSARGDVLAVAGDRGAVRLYRAVSSQTILDRARNRWHADKTNEEHTRDLLLTLWSEHLNRRRAGDKAGMQQTIDEAREVGKQLPELTSMDLRSLVP